MNFTLLTALACSGLFAGMVALVFLGRRLGTRRLAKHAEAKLRGNVVDGAVLSLLGLLVAFSFYGASGRLDLHRKLIADEANAIGTAYVRLDLLPERAQPALRDRFRDYVQSRVDVYQTWSDPMSRAAATSTGLRAQIWSLAVDACRQDCPAATMTLVYTSLNQMFDFPISQAMADRMHPPTIVFAMLFTLALFCALLVGYDIADMKKRSWLYTLSFPVILSVIIWVTLDLEFPRKGVHRLDEFDELIGRILVQMK